jgi:hypothetical protein
MSATSSKCLSPSAPTNAAKAGVIQLTSPWPWNGDPGVAQFDQPGYIGTELILSAPHLKALIDE